MEIIESFIKDMQQVKSYSDERFEGMCVYCGSTPDTRDHVPSKILLDEPFPENLPVVQCCDRCNQGFSLDEQYIACLIECALHGTTDISKISREKIKTTLIRSKPLQQMIADSMSESDGQIYFKIDSARLENFIIKLAKGHAQFEHSQPLLNNPTHLSVRLLHEMSDDDFSECLETKEIKKWPEVGSRAMIKIVQGKILHSRWIEVQPEKYYYQVASVDDGTSVKIIIYNYLIIEVTWIE